MRGISDDHGNLMVLITHNTDYSDSWEREGEDPQYFYKFSIDGYRLARRPEEITLGDVVGALEGVPHLIRCQVPALLRDSSNCDAPGLTGFSPCASSVAGGRMRIRGQGCA